MLKCVGRLIPPHPGPIPEEREKHRPTLEHCQDIRFADRLATILPLPGERAGVRGNGLRMVQVAPVQEMRVRCRDGSRTLQDLSDFRAAPEIREASWSAAALCRFFAHRSKDATI